VRTIDRQLRGIRRASFREKIPLNEKLERMVAGVRTHAFLINPASQNTYLYLARYVKCCGEFWFQRELGTLKLLDWGCGKGHFSFLLAELGANVTSCDLGASTRDSSFGQRTPIIEKARINVIPLRHEYRLPFEDNQFDIVLSFGVLEHVANDLESLREIHRILRPSGLFFCFALPYFLSWTQRLLHLKGIYYHDNLYLKRRARHLLAEADFQLVDMWHRQLFPKNTVNYPRYRLCERLDQILAEHTPLKYFATNIEFLAVKW
jgi:SAM-dependent methyltransferase